MRTKLTGDEIVSESNFKEWQGFAHNVKKGITSHREYSIEVVAKLYHEFESRSTDKSQISTASKILSDILDTGAFTQPDFIKLIDNNSRVTSKIKFVEEAIKDKNLKYFGFVVNTLTDATEKKELAEIAGAIFIQKFPDQTESIGSILKNGEAKYKQLENLVNQFTEIKNKEDLINQDINNKIKEYRGGFLQSLKNENPDIVFHPAPDYTNVLINHGHKGDVLGEIKYNPADDKVSFTYEIFTADRPTFNKALQEIPDLTRNKKLDFHFNDRDQLILEGSSKDSSFLKQTSILTTVFINEAKEWGRQNNIVYGVTEMLNKFNKSENSILDPKQSACLPFIKLLEKIKSQGI